MKNPRVQIQRLSETTMVKDCEEEVSTFLGCSWEEANGIEHRSCALIGDYEEVWRIKIGRGKWKYSHCIKELISWMRHQDYKK